MTTNEYLQPLWNAFESFADLPAVVDKDGRATTYRELGQLTRRIAGGLTKRKLPAHSFIPILLPTSMEYIAAEMGVWMAGHAFVPMGSTFPEGRVEYIREHCEAPLIIDEQTLQELAESEELSTDYHQASLEENALLIYTSGSTGEPKGILHAFDSLYNHTHKGLQEDHTDMVWGTSAPFYFVAAMSNFPVLKGGGQLHFYAGDVRFDVRKMEDYIEKYGVTHTFISPAVLANFNNRSASLKVVYTGSEKLVNQCSRDGYTLINNYGMTETMGTVFSYKVDQKYESTPVGKTGENSTTEWMLIGDDGKPVAEGEEGELILKGHFCKGYYKDPERTAQLYKDGWLHTNDIMRQLPDGNMVYVNRKDWMVKINGQRVEPGEVEQAIKRIEGVSQAIVKGFDNKTGSQYLCGYYTSNADVSPETIRTTLSAQLPPYMVPLHIVKVEEFSFLPNGKVNRKALLPPDATELQSNYVAPTNDTERKLCEAFAQLFHLDKVGIEDDFFMLGGDSIKVMNLQMLCEDLNLTSKIVYKGKTPMGIAQLLKRSTLNLQRQTSNVPLSQTQLGIYTESMARQGEAVYNNPILLKLDFSIDEIRLAHAVEKAVEAHKFIKTRIQENEEGIPLMMADDTPYLQTIEYISEDEMTQIKEQIIQPFFLLKDKLFRIRIIKTEKNLYLFTDFHHIIYDGTSMRIFMADIDNAFMGKDVTPEEWTGFDIALEETALRDTDSYTEAKEWYEKTFGAIEIDSRPIPDVQGDTITFGSKDLLLRITQQSIDAFCRRQGITANILTLAAFGKVLGSYANMQDSLFATIYNGRSSVNTARTMDMMVKTLPVYCHWTEDTRVSEFLQNVKQQLLGAMNNDIYSFAELAAATGINSDILFAYQGDYLTLGSVCGMPYKVIDLGNNATGSPLDVQIFTTADGPTMHVEYQQNLYSDAFITEMMHCYANVLRSMLTVERVVDIEMLDNDQIERLNEFNKTDVPYDNTQTVVSLFRQQAKNNPNKTILTFKDKEFTYKQVDEISDSLANFVTSKGIGSEDVVSILIPRSEWMVLASLGVLKAGCAYQPLDPTYPEERLNFMMKDADAKLLITSEELRQKVNEFNGDVWYIDSDIPNISPKSLPQEPKPEDLFTLLYTSGSTGVPKGCQIEHRNVTAFCNMHWHEQQIDSSSRIGAYASFGFDANLMETWAPLTTGAHVYIIPEEMRLDLVGLNNYFEQNSITHAFMTTQVARQFVNEIDNHSLKVFITGGEKLADVTPPPYMLINAYGPSESVCYVTSYPVREKLQNIPIGKAMENVHLYVIDSNGHRQPIGALGELWVNGDQVGRGYLNRPEKTAEAFVETPWGRCYRTGDIVRYMSDGNIEFIGRRDGQVKIRGFRIELSEVESVIREFPDVKNVTVQAFDDERGGKFIAAYIVSDKSIDVTALNNFIIERKPPYMVPAVTIQLDEIPLTQNQKVNKRALPKPELKSIDENDANRPLNVLEQELQSIVAKVVGVESIGITTPLIYAGLTSILSIKLLTQLYKRFGVEMQSKTLLNGASIETIENIILQEWMSGQTSTAQDHFADETKEAPATKSTPLSFSQTGVYYECMKYPTGVAYNIPTLLRFEKSITAERIAEAVKAIIDAHPVVNTHFEMNDAEVMQVPNNNDVQVIPELLTMTDVDLNNYKREFVRPFHLNSGPLCRFAIITTESCICLLADFHHLIFDGSSMDIFINQLRGMLNGVPVEKESYSYSQYVLEEKLFEDTPDFDANRDYFTNMLGDFESASELTADLKGKEEDGRMATIAMPFDMDAVSHYAQQKGLTPAATMLAAVFYTVSRYTASHNVYLSTISSGRSDVRISETFGMFVNTLPLGITIGEQTVSEFIRQSAEVFSGVIEHEKYPFARIAADYGFIPHIVYEYQIGVVGKMDIPGLISIEGLAADSTKFKLSIHIEQNSGKPCVVLYYNNALYSREIIEGLARSIVIVTDKLCGVPDNFPIKKIDLIDEARAKVLEKFHTEAQSKVPFLYFHEGLEQNARLFPKHKALVAQDTEMTYAELDAAANQIANNLIARGVKPRSRVALLLPRTSRVIISMFGTMKAGCAYIPCDPEYPAERIQHILNDSHATYIITTADHIQDFANAIDVETLLTGSAEAPKISITPQDLAYLIYTSGSTGKPKGVMLRHESIANYLYNHPSNTHIHALVEKAHVYLSVTTLSFDMSLKEVGAALFNGLTLVLASEEQATNPVLLADLFKQSKADAFNATPSRMMQYIELPAFAEAIAQCKVLMCGGEKYADGLLPKLRAAAPEARIFNTYGPTEITVSSNAKELTHTDQISIGRPLLNVTEYIVDKDGNELPPGIIGELYIGGQGVATGYNDLPEMTAERFIEYKGMRVYNSGDYARWTEKGDVVILGRSDNQIKLRGLRIELGEVEAALAAIKGIKSVVVKIGKIKGNEHLCAYFTADHIVDIDELKAELGKTLTKYMIPTAYLQLEKMPLTPNGKTDVKALPEPQIATSGDYEAPANETEKAICAIYADILGIDRVGANDSFFDIGGTSLLVTRVIIETDKLGYKVAYGDVFAHQSPRKLSNFILGIDENSESDSAVGSADEIADFDYSAIDQLLHGNTLDAFRLGKRQPLGNVLLTGATGYLGIHILHELIESEAENIYCLVRGKTKDAAENRLRTLLYYYFANAFKDLFGKRLHIVVGDVTEDLSEKLSKLNTPISTIFNCAAIVKHFSEGTEIEDVNVGGAERCVAYCLQSGAKLVHVSTASTRGLWVQSLNAEMPKLSDLPVFTEQRLYMGQYLGNKYIHSKFMAERLILDAVARHGLNAKIMRVGNLSARSTDGEFQANFSTNSFMGRIRVYNMLGCCPHEMRDSQVEFSPINEVSHAIVLLATTPRECCVFHPYNNHSVLLGDVLSELRCVGDGVRFVELKEFSEALNQAKEDPQKAKELSSMIAYQNMAGSQKSADVSRQNAYTMQVLYRMGHSWSATSWDYIDKFLSAISGLGFFDE